MSRFEGRTEKPTTRRRNEARKQGQVARSPEVGVALTFVGVLVAARSLFPGMLSSLKQGTAELVAMSGRSPSGAALGEAAGAMALAAAPLLALAVVLGVAGGVLQTGFSLSPGAIKPRLDRLDPRAGLSRLKPSQGGWELVRSFLKLGLLAAFVVPPVRLAMAQNATTRGLDGWLEFVGSQMWTLLVRVTALAVVIAAVDFGFARWRTLRSIKMTKEEVKQEHKDIEGDPLIKSQRRRRARELTRNRMIADVATADVLVMNPTHFAVALRYTMGEPAPRVVAKGAGRFALKLRSIAYRHGVMVRHDPPLARTLFRRCKVGQYVPAALYEAVAVVIAAAYRRRRRGIA